MNGEDRMEISIQIPVKEVEEILIMMAPDIGEMDQERVLKSFVNLGYQHFYEWLSSNKRYRTLTEQYIEWLEDIYTHLLPEEEPPSYSRMYNRFNIPYGQSGYMIRVLNERELPHIRRRALEELKESLENVVPGAKKAIQQKRPEQPFRISLSLQASRELRNITNLLYRINDETLLPERSSSYGDIKTEMVPAQTVLDVLEVIDKLITELE